MAGFIKSPNSEVALAKRLSWWLDQSNLLVIVTPRSFDDTYSILSGPSLKMKNGKL